MIIVQSRAAAVIPAEQPAVPEACTELNREGKPCRGHPVRDGRCPAHKVR